MCPRCVICALSLGHNFSVWPPPRGKSPGRHMKDPTSNPRPYTEEKEEGGGGEGRAKQGQVLGSPFKTSDVIAYFGEGKGGPISRVLSRR